MGSAGCIDGVTPTRSDDACGAGAVSPRPASCDDHFRLLFESLADFVFVVDQETGIIIEASEMTARAYGYARAELIGLSVAEISGEPEKTLQAVRDGTSPAVFRDHRRKDGTLFPVEILTSVVEWSPGHKAVIGVARDLSERKRSEEAVRESQERFRKLFEEVPLGIALIDSLSGRFYEVNPMYARIVERTVEELLRTDWMSITHPDDIQGDLDNMALVQSGAVPGFEMEKRYLHLDGAVVWVHMTIAKLKDRHDARPLHLCMVEDITERKRVEQEKASLETLLHQAQKMESIGRLAGGVAHDFNNMLTVILGHAELALDLLDPTSQPLGCHHQLQESLGEIAKAAHRSTELAQQLLAFARKQTITPKVLHLNEALVGMTKMLQRLIGEDIQIAWMPGTSLWTIKADPSQIDQILANLCVNARDAIDGVGKLTMETENTTITEADCAAGEDVAAGDYLRLSVSDDGRGMDQETMAHLFEPFFTTKPIGSGTGLGLSTVYGIVKQNHGFIRVDSKPGRGSTFSIYLPRYVGEDDTGKSAAAELAQCGHETILLVEDERSVSTVTRKMLERLGYTVRAAHTPGEAMSLYLKRPDSFHLLVTDVVMPEMSGHDLATVLRARHPGFKCLFMSGYSANITAHQGVQEDGLNFLRKPFTLAELAGKVRTALRG